MERRAAIILLLINLALVTVAVVAGVLVVFRLFSWPQPDVERHRRLAATLEANGLYDQALAAYETYRTEADLSPAEDANLHFQEAEVYQTKLLDPRSALGHYLMAKELNPKAGWAPEAEKRIVALLEGMGRSLDAQNRLTQATALEPKAGAKPGQVVAKLGDREITMAELDRDIQDLPADLQKKFADPAKKREYLSQYLLEQMLYHSAVRKGLAGKSEVKERLERIRKNVLAQMAYEEEMRKRVQVTPEEVKKYLAEHPDEVKDAKEATERLVKEKEAQARQELMQELGKLQEVKIYEDAFSQ